MPPRKRSDTNRPGSPMDRFRSLRDAFLRISQPDSRCGLRRSARSDQRIRQLRPRYRIAESAHRAHGARTTDYELLAYALRSIGRPADAARNYRNALDVDPNHGPANWRQHIHECERAARNASHVLRPNGITVERLTSEFPSAPRGGAVRLGHRQLRLDQAQRLHPVQIAR